jgi:hypothetical protein
MARDPDPPKGGMSKTKLLLGAGALFLFIVGVRKTWPGPGTDAAPPGSPTPEKDRD